MPEATTVAVEDQQSKKMLDFLEILTANADAVQQDVLAAILQQNGEAEYLARHGLRGAVDRETFKRLLPVIAYEDIEPDIYRIANGDTSPILCSRSVTEFLTSSGTSGGERKLMPGTEDDTCRRSLFYKFLMPVMSRYLKGLDKGKAMYLFFIKSEFTTPGGLPARPVLTSYYKSKYFRERVYDRFNVYTSPNEAVLCVDSFQSMYSQLLCGLIQNKEVLRVGAVFASAFIRAIHFLREHWPSLCSDIASGTVSDRIKDPAVRRAVQRLLRPDPALAEQIQRECSKDSWEGIVKRLWPNTKYIEVVITGAMAQYVPTLQFFGGGLPLSSTMYASSECYFGINLDPLCDPSNVSYTLLPNMCFYEFLPLNKSHDDDGGNDEESESPEGEELVDLVDVKIGHEYELVVTTYSGLCRYRVGDVLRVTGFHNKAPQFRFICRKNVVLSVDSDKTNEAELQAAVEKGARNLESYATKLLEYTSHADTRSTVPGHYVLFWELSGGTVGVPKSVFENCCLDVEQSLNAVYRQCRVEQKSLAPLEIRLVQPATFDAVMDFCVAKRGASINQYKAPRCVSEGPLLDLLNSRVMASFFSPKAPYWAPRTTLSKCKQSF